VIYYRVLSLSLSLSYQRRGYTSITSFLYTSQYYSPDLSLFSSTFVPRLPAFVKPKVFLLQLGYSPNPPPHLFSTPVLDERRHVMAPAQTSIPPAANILGVRHALYTLTLRLILICAPFLTDNRHCLLVCPNHPTDMA